MRPLFLRHALPYSLPRRVAVGIVGFGADDQDDIPGHEAQEDFIAPAVERFVLIAVDLNCQTGL